MCIRDSVLYPFFVRIPFGCVNAVARCKLYAQACEYHTRTDRYILCDRHAVFLPAFQCENEMCIRDRLYSIFFGILQNLLLMTNLFSAMKMCIRDRACTMHLPREFYRTRRWKYS